MALSKNVAIVSDECVACGCCESACPLNAITIFKGIYAKVEEIKCIGCGKCQRACPASVISIVERKVYDEYKKALV